MIKFKLVLLFICIAVFSKAQTVTFNRQLIFPTENDVSLDYDALQQTTDKGYITCRTTIDTTGGGIRHAYAELIKLDSAGVVQWSKHVALGLFSDSTVRMGLTVLQTADKGYMLGTSICKPNNIVQLILIKTDAAANVLWSKLYMGEGASAAYCIKQTHDKGYIVCGATKNTGNPQYGYIFKTDSMGNYTWGQKSLLGADTLAAFSSVVELPNRGYVACGYSNRKAIVAKFDLNGNLLWDKDLFKKGAAFNTIVQTSDKDILIGGSYNDTTSAEPRLCFLKLDTMGNIKWFKGYDQTPMPYLGSYVWSIKEMQNEFVFAGYLSDPIPSTIIAKMDLNGNFIWCNTYRSTFHTFNYTPNTIITTADGGFAFTTLIGILAQSNFSKVILKTDALGQLGCEGTSHPFTIADLNYIPTSSVTVSASGTFTPYTPTISNSVVNDTVYCESPAFLDIKKLSNNNQLNIYPNPAHNNFTIETTASDKQTMHLFDITGKMVLTQNIEGKAIIDVSGLSAGVYNLSLTSFEGTINKKLIIIK
ncbi:MAG TPA: T9SS type A sorting domain-containing protein [Bacteroidia bacterium]|nr:T9SS type A sorting domain-containing protein [Bacteroidia bacterium]